MNPRGVVAGQVVLVEDTADANRVYNKGFFGNPLPGNSLELSRTEAAYLVHNDRLDMDGSWADLLDDEVAYLAYADLRDRGLVVRHEGKSFSVWRRGQGPKDEVWFTFEATSERDSLRPDQLQPGVIGVVDEDGVVTHYEVTGADLEGSVMAVEVPSSAGVVLADRVIVDGHPFAPEFVGTPHGDQTILSFTEAEALRQRGVLHVPDDLPQIASKRQFQFERTLPVYIDLRRRGVAARSGFRFGTHLRAYRRDPDSCHAEWLVQCAKPGEEQPWSHISRAVRLAHGVRKKFVLAGGEPVTYWHLSWFRP